MPILVNHRIEAQYSMPRFGSVSHLLENSWRLAHTSEIGEPQRGEAVVDKGHAQSQFQKADDLYRSGRYEEALNVLNRLDAAFPDKRNIMYPRARCLRRLKRPQEAMEVCDLLIERYGDKRAAKLKNAIASAEAASHQESSIGFAPLSLEDLGITANPVIPPPPAARRQSSRALVLAALAVLAFVVLGLVVMLSRVRY